MTCICKGNMYDSARHSYNYPLALCDTAKANRLGLLWRYTENLRVYWRCKSPILSLPMALYVEFDYKYSGSTISADHCLSTRGISNPPRARFDVTSAASSEFLCRERSILTQVIGSETLAMQRKVCDASDRLGWGHSREEV